MEGVTTFHAEPNAMSQMPSCPKCGAPIPQDAPAGSCPKCLAQDSFESESRPQPEFAATAPSPASGDFEPPAAAERVKSKALSKLLARREAQAGIWTLACVVLYAVVWLPLQFRVDLPFLSLVDRHLWPYAADYTSTVSLIPKSKSYDRLLIREHLQTKSQGYEQATRVYPGSGGRHGLPRKYQFALMAPTSAVSPATLEIDALDNMAWRYHDATGGIQTGQTMDRFAVARWLNEVGVASKDEEADAIVNTIIKTATGGNLSAAYDTDIHAPVGRLELAVYSQGAALKAVGKFPFTSSAGSEKYEGGEVGSLFWTGLLATSAVWLAGLKSLKRRGRAI
jgi:hypothetical protein